jgi:hypothetical protein
MSNPEPPASDLRINTAMSSANPASPDGDGVGALLLPCQDMITPAATKSSKPQGKKPVLKIKRWAPDEHARYVSFLPSFTFDR